MRFTTESARDRGFIFKIFSPKNKAEILAFFAQTTASLCKNVNSTLVFKKNANFFDEYSQKSQKLYTDL
jgi:hypothetical protein